MIARYPHEYFVNAQDKLPHAFARPAEDVRSLEKDPCVVFTTRPRAELRFGSQIEEFERGAKGDMTKQVRFWDLLELCCAANGVPASQLPTPDPAALAERKRFRDAFKQAQNDARRAAADAAGGPAPPARSARRARRQDASSSEGSGLSSDDTDESEEESEEEDAAGAAGDPYAEEDVNEADKIVRVRRGSNGASEYLVRWKGYGAASDTWEVEEHILDKGLIDKYRITQGWSPLDRSSHRRGGGGGGGSVPRKRPKAKPAAAPPPAQAPSAAARSASAPPPSARQRPARAAASRAMQSASFRSADVGGSDDRGFRPMAKRPRPPARPGKGKEPMGQGKVSSSASGRMRGASDSSDEG